MFAREVTVHLKLNSGSRFTEVMENEIIPILRLQPGFKDEIAFLASNGKKAVAISLWDKKEDAELYRRGKYGEVLKKLADVIENVNNVETFEVSNLTWHKLADPIAV